MHLIVVPLSEYSVHIDIDIVCNGCQDNRDQHFENRNQSMSDLSSRWGYFSFHRICGQIVVIFNLKI